MRSRISVFEAIFKCLGLGNLVKGVINYAMIDLTVNHSHQGDAEP